MLLWLVFGIMFLAMITASIFSQLLIHRLFKEHSKAWSESGSPSSWFIPVESRRLLRGALTGRRAILSMLIMTPRWTNNDTHAQKLLLVYRACILLAIVGLFGFLLFALLLS